MGADCMTVLIWFTLLFVCPREGAVTGNRAKDAAVTVGDYVQERISNFRRR